MPPLDFDYEDEMEFLDNDDDIDYDEHSLPRDREDWDEPNDIDSDDGYDPYAGGPDMDCLSDDGPFSDFGGEY